MLNFKREQEHPVIMDITPEIAQHLLSTSPGNRKIRNWHIDVLAGSMSRGEWRVTSQGIGVDKNGHLRDAHHRLMAVIKSGVTIKSVVVMGLPLNSYEVTDTGIARNMADLLNESKRITDVLNFAARIYYDSIRTVTIDQMRPIVNTGLHDTTKELIKFCGTTRAFYSSAPIKLAACITIMNGGDADYVMKQYRALCILDFKSMSSAAMSLVKHVNNGKVTGAGYKEAALFRGFRVFDINQKDSSESTVRPESIPAAKKLVIDVLRTKIVANETKPAILENNLSPIGIRPANMETITSKNEKSSGIDDELKELLSIEPQAEGSYIHKSGDRRKFAKG